MDINTILKSQGINPDLIRKFDYLEDDSNLIIVAQIKGTHKKCPYCESKNTIIKEYKTRKIKGLNIGKKITEIELRIPRYKCKNCNKTFTYDTSEFIDKSITIDERNELLKTFSNMETFSDIAKSFNLSLSEVIKLFDKYCPWLNEKIGEAICIDEFKNSGTNDLAKYACLLVNFETHKIIDILPSRTLPYLRNYFSKQPLFARKMIKYLVTDMYDGYITIAKEFLPNAIIAIDPFHYVRYFTDAVQNIRIRKLSNEKFYFYDAPWIKSNRRLLTVDLNKNCYQENKIVLTSGETISIYDRVMRFVRQDYELNYAVTSLQDFYFESKRTKFNGAESLINFTINRLINSNIKELIDCGKTWENYKEYIINSFLKFKDKRLSNGPIEGINSRIKALKKIYCGYSNYKRFYKRVIYIINQKKDTNSSKKAVTHK